MSTFKLHKLNNMAEITSSKRHESNLFDTPMLAESSRGVKNFTKYTDNDPKINLVLVLSQSTLSRLKFDLEIFMVIPEVGGHELHSYVLTK